MGCDAHFFLERRVNKGEWHVDPGHRIGNDLWNDGSTYPVEIPSLSGRSYYFFGVVAGVRATYINKPIAEGRGLPTNISPVLKEYFVKHDFHSPTFMSPKELERSLKRYNTHINRSYDDETDVFKQPSSQAFNYSDDLINTINGAVINYIRENLAWEKAENQILGLKNKTEYRIIVWFDS
jgi:hypothetical protein